MQLLVQLPLPPPLMFSKDTQLERLLQCALASLREMPERPAISLRPPHARWVSFLKEGVVL